ncbi:MAG TPA: hypothetical protein VFA46_08365 [Actinomycetes bacterium]|jgi:hypothetical protein|nr:hypothetical protein [Actinomycetes bacterium]
MPARSLAEWAAAAPAARDAVLALAEHAVALQPAAEAVIQWYRLDERVAPDHAEEGRRVERAYRDLVQQVARIAPDPVVAEPLTGLLQRHLDVVRRATDGSRPPEGLGRLAGELVSFRDLLRRTGRVRGRAVADVPEL